MDDCGGAHGLAVRLTQVDTRGPAAQYRGRHGWRVYRRDGLAPLLGIITINPNSFSLPTMLVSLLGAILLLTVVSLFRRPGGLGLP